MPPTDFEQGLDTVARLVKQFNRNAATYRNPDYNETRARIEFINPLFEALGWDVTNREGNAPQYQEVIHEFSEEIEGVRKAPDYAFRTGSREPKFFVEAKKPGVNVKTDARAAYQLRRYAWSARLPLSRHTAPQPTGCCHTCACAQAQVSAPQQLNLTIVAAWSVYQWMRRFSHD